MGEYRLGVCDRDMSYAVSFMSYINMRDDIPFLVCVYSSVTDVMDAVRKGLIDIVLIDDYFEPEETDILIVRFGEATENSMYAKYICKYRSIPDICEYILSLIGGKVIRKENKTGKFLAVYMPAYNHKLAKYALREMSEYKNALLIRMQEFRTYTGDEELSDKMMYYLLGHNEELYKLLLTNMNRETDDGGGRIIYGPDSYVDIRELRRGDLEWLKRLIAEKSDRSMTVIFEFETGVLSELDCLLAFDRVYVPYLSDAWSMVRLNKFKEAIAHLATGTALEKIIYENVEEHDANGGVWSKGKIKAKNIGEY